MIIAVIGGDPAPQDALEQAEAVGGRSPATVTS